MAGTPNTLTGTNTFASSISAPGVNEDVSQAVMARALQPLISNDVYLKTFVDARSLAAAPAFPADEGKVLLATATGGPVAVKSLAEAGIAANTHGHSNASATVAGFMAATDKAKLDGVATGATANSSDATLLDRANHTGAQAISTITNLTAELAAKAAIAANETITGDWVHDGKLGLSRGGRFMDTDGSAVRYLSNNPNRVQNPSGELDLTGWTPVTGTPSTFEEAEGGWCFRATAAFEMYTDVKVWRANKDEWVSVLPAFQSEGTEIQVELLDGAKTLLATLTAWTNITAAGIVLGYAANAGWVSTGADGYLRVRLRSIATPLADTRFRGVAVAYGLPVIGGGHPVHLLRWLYDNRGAGAFEKPRPHEATLVGATSGETITLPAADADSVAYAGKADFVEYAASPSETLETLAASQWSYNDATRVLTFNGQTLAGAEVVVHLRGRVV